MQNFPMKIKAHIRISALSIDQINAGNFMGAQSLEEDRIHQ